jgi:hypothetical protein
MNAALIFVIVYHCSFGVQDHMVQCSLDALQLQEMVELPKQVEAFSSNGIGPGGSAAASALSSGSEAVLDKLIEGLAEVRDGVQLLVRRSGFGVDDTVQPGDGVELLETQVTAGQDSYQYA